MCKKLALLILLLGIWLSPCAQAVTIVWVAEALNNASGVPFDQGWVDLLEGEGYTVDVQRGAWMTLDAAHLAQMEAADLVIVSRTTNSGNYATDATEVTQWNSVTTPLLMMTAYLPRNSRWLWVNSATLSEPANEAMLAAVVADHPIFAGVPLTDGQVDVINGTVDSGQMCFLTTQDVGNGTLLARRADNTGVWIAEWEAGTPFYTGSTQTPAGKRMLLTAGGGTGQTMGSMNFTADGQRIFLNAVRYMLGLLVDAGAASAPAPGDKDTDVPIGEALSWTAGENAATHDVYFGTTFADVNDATRTNSLGVLAATGQSASSFDPAGVLAYGQTYYWRVDEIEADGTTIHKGATWSFTAEPFAVTVTDITATASSSSPGLGPENTINGSGMDGDLHGTTDSTMWLSGATGEPEWIEYAFDRVYKLHEMWVWNYNVIFESLMGVGIKDATVEYSVDGETWMPLGDFEFAQGISAGAYAHNTTVDFAGVPVRYVRITAKSNWAGLVPQFGLSEVRFLYIPAHAREPQPDSGATGIDPSVVLSWRAGRGSVSHDVYVSTDSNAVADGTAPSVTLSQASYVPPSLNLATTYYWKVVEVNAAEDPAAWDGDVWSFSTAAYLAVDDFESYTNESPKRVFQTWIDGAGFSPDEFFPDGNPGNGTSSFMGNDPTQGEIMETTVVHGGAKSVPFFYDNTTAAATSETTRTFATARDWTRSAVTTLTLYFYGDVNNVGSAPLWVKLTDQSGKSATATFGAAGEDVTALADQAWTEWNMPLSGFAGIDLTKVASMTVGVGPGTASGQLFLDDIRLYPQREIAAPITPVLVGHWKLDNNAQDSSGNGNNGTLSGGPTYVAAGKIGAALSVDGIDDYVDCGNAAGLNITDAVTLSVWVNTSDAANGQHNDFVGKGDQSYCLKHYLDNYIQFFIYDGGWFNSNGPAVTMDFNGSWHHLAGTYDGTQGKLYVDGKLVGSVLHTGVIATSTYNVNIGRNSQNTDRLYYGLIDDVRIYHGALPKSEVLKLANP
jgi:hypothetical protein